MVNTEIRLIIIVAEDRETLYSQQKQDCELTATLFCYPKLAQIMNSLL